MEVIKEASRKQVGGGRGRKRTGKAEAVSGAALAHRAVWGSRATPEVILHKGKWIGYHKPRHAAEFEGLRPFS